MKKIVLVIGHSNEDKGATNKSYGANEFDFNSKLAEDIKFEMKQSGKHNCEVVYRVRGLQELPNDINKHQPDIIVSLHCNAYNTNVEGCEVLYYHKSKVGKEIAQIFHNELVTIMENRDRGLKPCGSEDRGGYLLRYTQAPCIITEPFFIDNDNDYIYAKELLEDGTLTQVYLSAIYESLEKI